MNKKILIILFCSLFLFTGCFVTPQLSSIYDNEVQTLDSQAAFSITLPADWEIGTDEATLFSAVSPKGNMAISVIAEFSGFTFYNMEDLAAKVTEYVHLDGLTVSYVQKGLNNSKQYHQLFDYTDAEGVAGILDNYIYNPYLSVVYYLFLTCSAAEYDMHSYEFSEIINSFKPNKTQDEYYEMISKLPIPEKTQNDEKSLEKK